MNTEETQKNNIKFAPIIVGGIMIGIAVGAGVFLFNNDSNNNGKSLTSSSSLSSSSLAAASFKDGIYAATGNYISPGGATKVDVEIEVKNGKIDSVTITTPSNTERESKEYQALFASGISAKINGKPLNEAYVQGSVNGSSLTGNGFNKALDSIINQAKS